MAMDPPPNRLLPLPRELRDTIYAYALAEDFLHVTPAHPRSDASIHPRYLHQSRANARQPGICGANKQLREEPLPVYYNINTFAIDASV